MPAGRLRALLEHLRERVGAYVVLVVALLATLGVHLYLAAAVNLQERSRFDDLVEEAVAAARTRTDAYVAALRATRGLFAGGREPTRGEFRAFVRSLELGVHSPGIQGISFIERVPGSERARLEARVRAEGIPDFHVWPEGTRDAYPILAIEPLDAHNRRALGFDVASDPIRREALERARATGEPACSGKIVLVQDGGKDEPGFLVVLPVPLPQPLPVAQDAGPTSRIGFVGAPFRARDLLGSSFGVDRLAQLSVEVYDGARADQADVLFRSGEPPRVEPALSRVSRILVAGRPWTLRFTGPAGRLLPWAAWIPPGVGAIGVLLSLLLFRVTKAEAETAAAARRAARRARFLADVGKVLSSSLDPRAAMAQVATRASRDQADWCVVRLEERGAPFRLVGHGGASEASAAADAMVALVEGIMAWRAEAGAVEEPFLHHVEEADLRRLQLSPASAAALRAEAPRCMLAIPLRVREEELGLVALASVGEASLGEGDVGMGGELARLAQAALEKARLYEQAQEAVRLRDEFLSVASHELKTPLTSLALQADSLVGAAAGFKPTEGVARKAEVIRRNVDRLTKLITNLLDISRIREGHLDLELDDVDLAEVVKDVAGRFAEELSRAGCRLELDVEEPIVGRWDRMRLDQVVTNLLSNAVKYGAGKPIWVSLRADPERAVLTVRDEGIGIPREAHDRIFQRFERAVSERHYGGFGVGLWIVRRILEALGGEVTVESQAGHGAAFTVSLRRRPAVERAAQAVGA